MTNATRELAAPTSSARGRQRQLDGISMLLSLALLVTLILLVYYVSSTGMAIRSILPLGDPTLRTLVAVFVVLMVVYVWDQRRRLQAEVDAAVEELVETRDALDDTIGILGFSHEAASRLAAQGIEAGLEKVLAQAAELYEADAAAVMGEDTDWVSISDGVAEDQAQRALMVVAVTAAGRPEPLLMGSLGLEEGRAIVVPLRVDGELRFVLSMWNREREFRQEQLDSLGLMGRMIELAIEREELLEEAQTQLEGTLSVLQYLVADKRPDYTEHARRVSELANDIAVRLGMRHADRKSLRLAGLVHDVGIMSIAHDLAAADKPLTAEERLLVQQHPRVGADIARVARFDRNVQEAVESHHERLDGSGYPNGLTRDEIPLSARILAVCEVFDSMTHRTYHGSETGLDAALHELRSNAGVLYDRETVDALVKLVAGPAQADEPDDLSPAPA